MTSVEIRKKFLACRQYKLRGVDQVDKKSRALCIYRAESFNMLYYYLLDHCEC